VHVKATQTADVAYEEAAIYSHLANMDRALTEAKVAELELILRGAGKPVPPLGLSPAESE
jgi:hypothetical protein